MKNVPGTTDWLIKGIPEEQLEIEKTLALISAKINLQRIKLGMDQKSFAKFMGVTQGLVSRWESGSYNFSVATLITVCKKIGLSFAPRLTEKEAIEDNVVYVMRNSVNSNAGSWSAWKPTQDDILLGGAA
ncbi:MAG: helix-turn-helix transcriptional regulator [Clostridia bacterium]|nr:helix-turn-helix transcriptional regulator [Clostridia bacterium]